MTMEEDWEWCVCAVYVVVVYMWSIGCALYMCPPA
jgi:hypothetical protein